MTQIIDQSGATGQALPDRLVKTIVLGVDGSPESAYATGWVANLAAGIGARVVMIRALSTMDGLVNDGFRIDPRRNWRQEMRRQIHGDWARPLREMNVEHKTRLVEKTPGPAILMAATEEHADLIAVGSHHQRRLSAYLSHHATCPVVAIPMLTPVAGEPSSS